MVFESNDGLSIALAKGLLENTGIPFWMQDDESASGLLLGPFVFSVCRFHVPKDREVEARELLATLAPPQGEERQNLT